MQLLAYMQEMNKFKKIRVYYCLLNPMEEFFTFIFINFGILVNSPPKLRKRSFLHILSPSLPFIVFFPELEEGALRGGIWKN